MADRPRFGPAGVPPTFRLMNAGLSDIPRLLREEGLDAFEYEAIHWGTKPQIKKEDAERLGVMAKENDVWLSMHGSYFINLLGEKSIVEASKKRLIACAIAADWMKAHVVVFHPGFYGKKSRAEALKNCVEAMKEVVAEVEGLGIRDVKFGAESMGKPFQFGSLEDVLGLCEAVEQNQLVIDWSHLHARDRGRFRKVEDFRKVVDEIEKRLGKETAENMHCHFTKIEFSDKGERRHRILDEVGYGPNFEMLAMVIAEFGLRPVIISESPLLDIDALKMRDIVNKKLEANA
jgi:deoxyribonuclease-4